MERRFSDGKVELSLSNRTVALLGIGAVALLAVVFALGMQIGKGLGEIQAGKVAEYEVASADAIVVDGAAEDKAGAQPEAAHEEALTDDSAPAPKEGVAYGFYDAKEGEPTGAPTEVEKAQAPTAPGQAAAVSLPSAPVTPPPAPEPTPPAPPVAAPAASSAPMPPVPAPKVSVGGRKVVYTVQVAAFPTAEEARKLNDRLLKKGLASYIAQANIRGTTWHRVRVGKFADKQGAQAMAEAIAAKEGLKPFIDTLVE